MSADKLRAVHNEVVEHLGHAGLSTMEAFSIMVQIAKGTLPVDTEFLFVDGATGSPVTCSHRLGRDVDFTKLVADELVKAKPKLAMINGDVVPMETADQVATCTDANPSIH